MTQMEIKVLSFEVKMKTRAKVKIAMHLHEFMRW